MTGMYRYTLRSLQIHLQKSAPPPCQVNKGPLETVINFSESFGLQMILLLEVQMTNMDAQKFLTNYFKIYF